jgi:hypothetical protein
MKMMRIAAMLGALFVCAPALAQGQLSANSVWGNPTSAQALPRSMAIPSCAGATNALIYTLGTGFGCSSTVSPGGAAGGDLGGTYPNPTVTNLSHVTNASLPNSGLVNAATTVNGVTCTLGGSCTATAVPSGTAGGDLGGTYPNPGVAKINGVALGATTATAGNFMIGSGTQWVSHAISGDCTVSSSGVLTCNIPSGHISGIGDLAANVSGRLTLTTGTPITLANVTGATTLYFTPYNGDSIALFDGVSAWTVLNYTELSLLATQTQTCTLHTSTTVDTCTDTSQMVVGEQVTGANIPGGTTIATITNATSFTTNNAATGSGVTSLTFKLPTATNYDVFLFNSSGTPKLEWGPAWTNDTTRATALAVQNGVDVKSGATTRRLLGTIRTIAVAGQMEDSLTHRFVSNRYNEQPRDMLVNESAAQWNYTLITPVQANSNTANQLDYVATVSRPTSAQVSVLALQTGTVLVIVGVGVDVVNANSAQISIPNNGLANQNAFATYTGTPGVGRHFLAWLNYVNSASGTVTWVGCAECTGLRNSGIYGSIAN